MPVGLLVLVGEAVMDALAEAEALGVGDIVRVILEVTEELGEGTCVGEPLALGLCACEGETNEDGVPDVLIVCVMLGDCEIVGLSDGEAVGDELCNIVLVCSCEGD